MEMEMVFGCSIESTEPTVRYPENTSYTPYTYRASECICYGTPVDYVIAHQPGQCRCFPTHKMLIPYLSSLLLPPEHVHPLSQLRLLPLDALQVQDTAPARLELLVLALEMLLRGA